MKHIQKPNHQSFFDPIQFVHQTETENRRYLTVMINMCLFDIIFQKKQLNRNSKQLTMGTSSAIILRGNVM